MEGLLEGRAAIVTGAASPRGLGLAAAKLMAEHGARVLITDLDAAAAAAAANSLPGTGHAGARCDVTNKAECDASAAIALARFGRIDVLVNIAGITSPQRLMEVDAATYERIFDINMRGTLFMTQAVVPSMRAARRGSIVNMSSVSAQRGGGVFGGSHYSAAKAAILGYTKAAARELGPDNIRVNAICPSFIDTDITAGLMTPDKLAAIVASTPMGRPGHAHEVAGCVLFLASDLASYVTGSELDINGGNHIH
ncbi:MAG: SDR family oxidoreductase [Aquincola sp.]|nr:SDR family oxidoreductase [Aquincola sp.]MDH4287343.1 SDR family oxidoreductase [Aquincola sp.]MDH5329998.1 SDR family oxidoreductase [Aquincola sp.]